MGWAGGWAGLTFHLYYYQIVVVFQVIYIQLIAFGHTKSCAVKILGHAEGPVTPGVHFCATVELLLCQM